MLKYQCTSTFNCIRRCTSKHQWKFKSTPFSQREYTN